AAAILHDFAIARLQRLNNDLRLLPSVFRHAGRQRKQNGIASGKQLRTMRELVGFDGNDGLGLTTVGRNSQNAGGSSTEQNLVIGSPARTEGKRIVANRDGGASTDCNFLNLFFRGGMEPDPLAIRRKER